jgi:hypothetical protein
MIFAPTVCHSHTITLCMARRRDSINGAATCYRLDSRIWAPVGGKRFSLSHTCVVQPRGPPSRVYSGKWPTFLEVQQSEHGAGHPSQTSADIKNLYSYTTAPSVCYRWHDMEWLLLSTYMWLIVHEPSFYVSAQKKSNKQWKCKIQGIFKESIHLPFVAVVTGKKRAQFNVLFQNITLLLF